MRFSPTVPPARFAVAFGLTGLAGTWDSAGRHLHASPLVGQAIAAIAAVVLISLLVVYVAERTGATGAFAADFSSPVGFPFLALPILSAELLTSRLAPAFPWLWAGMFAMLASAGAVLAVVHLSRLASGRISAEHLHGGQLLPSVAGTIVPALVLSRLGFDAVATALLGVGLVLAVVFTVVLAGAAIGGAPVATPLLPTLAILIAPPALGGTVALELGATGLAIAAFAGLVALALALQLALLPALRRGGFSLAFWSFSFPIAAAIGFGIGTPAGALPAAVAWSALGLLTAAVGALTATTIWQTRRSARVRVA